MSCFWLGSCCTGAASPWAWSVGPGSLLAGTYSVGYCIHSHLLSYRRSVVQSAVSVSVFMPEFHTCNIQSPDRPPALGRRHGSTDGQSADPTVGCMTNLLASSLPFHHTHRVTQLPVLAALVLPAWSHWVQGGQQQLSQHTLQGK
jgi:hypothetical protein